MGRLTEVRGARPALEGDLGRYRAAEILQFLRLSGATGRLVLERPGERAELHLTRGSLALATTDRGSVRLGEVLLHRGWIALDVLGEALDHQRAAPGERLAALLAARGAVSRERLRDALGEVFGRILIGVVLWREGRFRFDPADAGESAEAGVAGTREAGALPDPGIAADIDLDGLIFESLRQADEVEEGARQAGVGAGA